MAVEFSALKAVDPQRFDASARAWSGLRDHFTEQRDDYKKKVLDPVSDGSWQGAAAEAAQQRVRRTYDRLGPTRTYMDSVQVLLKKATTGITAARAQCAQGIEISGFVETPLNADGTLRFYDRPPDNIYWDQPAVVSAMRAANLIYQARHMASYVDAQVSQMLNYATKFDGAWTGDAEGDHQSVLDFAQTMQANLDGIATDEPTHRDTPAQPYAIESPGAGDYQLWTELSAGPSYFAAHDWQNAAVLLQHWLGNSGNTSWINPATMLDDIPQFKQAVTGIVSTAGHDRIGRSEEGVSSFDSGWQNVAATEGDWYWALHDFRFRVVGITTVANGRQSTQYTVGVLKPYVFGDSANEPFRVTVCHLG